MNVCIPAGLISLPALLASLNGLGDEADRTASARAEALVRTRAEIEALIDEHWGVDEVQFALEPFREEVRLRLQEQSLNGVRTFRVGGNDFGKAISASAVKPEWLYDWDASKGELPARHVIIDFDRKLKAIGVDLIVVPVPSKIEAYTREFETELPDGMPVAMGRLDEILHLLDAGVEVVDVLPRVLSVMTDDDAIPAFETTGHHISGLGVRHVGAQIAERLERYEFEGRDKERFSDVKRESGERITPSVPMFAWEVLDRGKPYDHVPDSEVIVIGDSNAFAYGRASWASHIARCTGIPITDISTSSGAPTAHARLASQGLAMVEKRRVVIWIISSTHMERRPWSLADIPEHSTLAGLFSAGAIDEAIALYESQEKGAAELGLDEGELNDLGYQLLGQEKFSQAAAIFLINTKAFPHSANAFDSLGEASMKTGDRDVAIAALKKALSLNPPANTRANSMRLLAELGVEYTPPEAHALSEAAMEALAGEYSLTGDNTGFVRIENGGLVFEFVGQPKMGLTPLSDVLFTTESGFTVEFELGDEGTPPFVGIRGRGMTFEGSRVE